MKKKLIPVSRKDNLIIQEFENETLVYDLNADRAICLNETLTLIWQMCDGERDVDAVKKSVSRRLNTAVSDDLIWLALDQLKKENLIENSNELEIKFEGISRREVIRKIGLGSMIALPVISSLIAPQPAMAASVCGQSCQNNNDCQGIPNCSTCGQRLGGAPNDKICRM